MEYGGTTTVVSETFPLVDIHSVDGAAPLRFKAQHLEFECLLYKLQGIDVQWIGIVLPDDLTMEPIPHIFFHPTAQQAGILDVDYAAFSGGWAHVWQAYCKWMGAQIAAADRMQQALILPLYRSAQARDLGNFNRYWKPVLLELLDDAFGAHAPFAIYGPEVSFSKICTSSFSVGIVAHMHFHSRGADVVNMTDKAFDLDGKFGRGHWAMWRSQKAIIYQDRPVEGPNPQGNVYRLGDRWSNAFRLLSRGSRHQDTHWLTAQYMLYHGIMKHATPQLSPP
jgi:hypothetical protein